MAGKRNSQVVAAILNNFDAVNSSIETMQNSAGNAEQEMGVIMDSIEYKTNRLKETAVGIAQDIFQRDSTKRMVDNLTSLLEIINSLTKAVGGLGTAFVGLMAYKGFKGQNIFNVLGASASGVNSIKNFFTQPVLTDTAVKLGITNSDIKILQDYNHSLQNGTNATLAFRQTMKGASPETRTFAKEMARGNVSLNQLTTSSKAAAIGMNLLNAAMNIGISLAVSALVKGLYELGRAYENAAEKADELSSKAKEKEDENKQIQELIDKYKELKEAETFENRTETRNQLLELQREITDLVGKEASNVDLVNGNLETQLGILKDISNIQYDDVIKSAESAYEAAQGATQKFKYSSNLFTDGAHTLRITQAGHSSNGEVGKRIISQMLKDQDIGHTYRDDTANQSQFFIDFDKDVTPRQQLDFLNQVIDELKSSSEFSTKERDGIYDKIFEARNELDEVIKKEDKAAIDYSQKIIQYTSNQKVNDVDTVGDFIKARQEIINSVSSDETIQSAILSGALKQTDVDKYVDEYLASLNSISDIYNKWKQQQETYSDYEKAKSEHEAKQIQETIVDIYKSAYDGAEKELSNEKPLTLLEFESESYKKAAKQVSQTMSDLENAVKAIDDGGVPEPELFTEFPHLAEYANDTKSLRQAILELMSEVPNDLINELIQLKDNIELSSESVKNALEELSLDGTVNLSKRPVIDAQLLRDVGWDEATGDVATVYSSTYTNGQTGKKAIAINFTPIVVDENGKYIGVLSPDELDEYAEEVIAGVRTDDLHLQIGVEFTGKNAEKEAASTAEYIHELQEYYYLYSANELTEEENRQKKQIDGFITLLGKLTNKVKGLNGELTNITAKDYIQYEEDNIQSIIDKLEKEKDAQNEILESLKSQKEELEGIISDYEKTADIVGKYIDRIQIKPLENRKSEIENYYNTQIEKLKEENGERDRNIELQEKQDALANARKTKIKVYTETQGWTVKSDVNAIKNAEKELKDLQNDITIDSLEKQRDSEISDIEKQIKVWEDYKDAWKAQVEQITEADEELVASKILGADWHEKIADQDIDVMNNYGAEYVSYNNRLKNQVNVEISNMEKAIKAREKEITEWKDYKEQITDINKTITESNDTYLQNLNQFVIDENSTWEERIKHMERNAEIIAMLNGKANEIPETDAENILAGSKMWSITKDDSILGLYSSKEEAEADKKNVIQNLVKKQIAPGMPSNVIETITKRIMESLHIKQYARGGISTKTGLSWLDGTSSGAEVIFNAAQAKQLYDIVANGNFGRMVSENILDGMKALVTSFGNKQSQPAPSSINISFPNATINAKDYDSFKNFMDTYTTDLLLKMQVGL